MTTDQDPAALAREVLALAEKATPGPWKLRRDENIEGAGGRIIHADGRQHSGDADLIAHAGTHYATLCRALLAAHEREKAMREALENIAGGADLGAAACSSEGPRGAFKVLASRARKALTPETKP